MPECGYATCHYPHCGSDGSAGCCPFSLTTCDHPRCDCLDEDDHPVPTFVYEIDKPWRRLLRWWRRTCLRLWRRSPEDIFWEGHR